MIVAAAIKIGDIICSMPPPNRHHNIIHSLSGQFSLIRVFGKQGFVDHEGTFKTRKEAYKEAVRCGQIKDGDGYNKNTGLFSEDLW